MRFKFLVSILAFALAAAIHSAPASAAACVQQTTWTTGETETAALLNADPQYIDNTCLQNLDHTNVGAQGFYFSQLKPLTVAEAIFGGGQTPSSVYYTFQNNVLFQPSPANAWPYAPVVVYGNDSSTYTTPSGEFPGEYSPGILANITQTNTGVPTGVMGIVQSGYGSNSSNVAVDSSIIGGQLFGVLTSGSNNGQVDGLYAQSIDNSGSTGHSTAKGDAVQIGAFVSVLNSSLDPSTSALGYCGTAECLQGSPRIGLVSQSGGTYPIVAGFSSNFTTGTGGGSDNAGNRPYIGYLSSDSINADFEACDAQNIATTFSQTCKATYGFLSNAVGIANASNNRNSEITAWFGNHWTGTASARDIIDEGLVYTMGGANAPFELSTVIDGIHAEGTFDDGMHEFDGNDYGSSLTTRLASILTYNPYTYQTAINENSSAAQAESDYYNIIPNAVANTATNMAHAFHQYYNGVDTLLGYIARDGSAHFLNTPRTYIDGTSTGDTAVHEEVFRNVAVGTSNVTKTFAASFASAPACVLGPYSTSVKIVSQPTVSGVTVVSSVASVATDIDCKGT